MEFWALIGLASMDKIFLTQLFKNKENPERIVRDYGFRLSRWEMGELRRILENDKAFHHLHAICHEIWAEAFNPRDAAPCWWSAERSAEQDAAGDEPYVHPLKNGHPVPKPRPGRDSMA
jgi:hypothetical protein